MHRQSEMRTLALHRLIAERIRQNPELLEHAKSTLARWRVIVSASSQPYLVEWEGLMAKGIDACLAGMLEESEHAAALRKSSPFAGILSEHKRRAFLAEWRATNAGSAPAPAAPDQPESLAPHRGQ